jgi:thioredoxin-related protein
VKAEMQKYDVKSFPTIKMFMEDGKTIEFDSKVSKESLEKFATSVL